MKPNKFLGQVFLKSRKIAEEIVKAADLSLKDIVLEIGPGKGILTEELVKEAKKVIAVEKDERLVEFLREKFKNPPAGEAGTKNLKIIHGDALKFSISNFQFSSKSQFSNYKIVANLPYYITSRFLKTFLQSDFQPILMVLMVQKEVGERIIARDRKESILSISVKVYGQPKIIKTIPPHYFSPKPKVDSVILKIDKISKDFFRDAEKPVSLITGTKGNDTETRFFSLLKRGFSQKRKMLINNLKCKKNVFEKCGIPEKARAEDLSPENWKCLYKALGK